MDNSRSRIVKGRDVFIRSIRTKLSGLSCSDTGLFVELHLIATGVRKGSKNPNEQEPPDRSQNSFAVPADKPIELELNSNLARDFIIDAAEFLFRIMKVTGVDVILIPFIGCF